MVTTITGPLSRRRISLYEAKQSPYQLLPAPLTSDQHNAIQTLTQFTPQQGLDELVWNLSASGQFSVNSVYKLLSCGGRVCSAMVSLWKARVTLSMRCFFFLFIKGRLLTHDVMQRRSFNYQPRCLMCARSHPEIAMHLFFLCPYAHQVWSARSVASGFTVLKVNESLSLTYFSFVPNMKDRRQPRTTLFITTVWLLWRERNERTFRDKKSPPFVLLGMIQ